METRYWRVRAKEGHLYTHTYAKSIGWPLRHIKYCPPPLVVASWWVRMSLRRAHRVLLAHDE